MSDLQMPPVSSTRVKIQEAVKARMRTSRKVSPFMKDAMTLNTLYLEIQGIFSTFSRWNDPAVIEEVENHLLSGSGMIRIMACPATPRTVSVPSPLPVKASSGTGIKRVLKFRRHTPDGTCTNVIYSHAIAWRDVCSDFSHYESMSLLILPSK